MSDEQLSYDELVTAVVNANRITDEVNTILRLGRTQPMGADEEVQESLSRVTQMAAQGVLENLTELDGRAKYPDVLATLRKYEPHAESLKPVIQKLETAYSALEQAAQKKG